jgi:hypothetical protein
MEPSRLDWRLTLSTRRAQPHSPIRLRLEVDVAIGICQSEIRSGWQNAAGEREQNQSFGPCKPRFT